MSFQFTTVLTRFCRSLAQRRQRLVRYLQHIGPTAKFATEAYVSSFQTAPASSRLKQSLHFRELECR